MSLSLEGFKKDVTDFWNQGLEAAHSAFTYLGKQVMDLNEMVGSNLTQRIVLTSVVIFSFYLAFTPTIVGIAIGMVFRAELLSFVKKIEDDWKEYSSPATRLLLVAVMVAVIYATSPFSLLIAGTYAGTQISQYF